MSGEHLESQLEQRLIAFLDALEQGQDLETEELCRGLQAADRDALLESVAVLRGLEEERTDPLARGRILADRYRLDGEIGRGGFGRVWRARDRHLQRTVAVKFVEFDERETRDRERLENEVNALLRTDSSGIARIFDVGHQGGNAFLVLEYVDGRPLDRVFARVRERCRDRRPTGDDLRAAIHYALAPGQVDLCGAGDDRRSWYRAGARICVSILRTLEQIHAAGVRHRDIKPSNILLRGSGRPVLVDFGLAVDCDERFRRPGPRDTLSGSLSYLPPECIKSRRTGTDGRSDVYQVGLLLYEFLALRPRVTTVPAADDELPQVSRFLPPSAVQRHVPADLEQICLCALASAPEDRYQTAAAFRRDLERWLTGTEVPVALWGGDLRSRWLRLPYLLRRHRTAALLVVGALLGGLAVWSTCVAAG